MLQVHEKYFQQTDNVQKPCLLTETKKLPLQPFEKVTHTRLFLGSRGHALLGALIYLEFAAAEILPTSNNHLYQVDHLIRVAFLVYLLFRLPTENRPVRHQTDFFKRPF